MDKRFGTHLVSETSSDDEASMRKACMIEENNGYEAREFEEISMENDVEVKRVNNNHEETFPTIVLRTWVLIVMIWQDSNP